VFCFQRDRADEVAAMDVMIVENGYLATVDSDGTEYASGHLVVEGNRIVAVGAGAAPAPWSARATRTVDASGCLLTPGLVNTHHHLYQWLTRGLAQDATLFQWLTTLYPIWAGIDAESVQAAAAADLGWMALSGCTLSTDHGYVHPHGGGDVLEAEIRGAQQIGLRFHPTRGSMNLGRSQGGLPPDSVVEDHDEILRASDAAIDRWHDPAGDAMLQIALAPCSPFSVTGQLMRESAELARRRGVRLHTHLAETVDEEQYCLDTFGLRPVDYAESLGWLGDDVWLAHCVHLSDGDIAAFARTGTGTAHCPTSNGRLGSGIAPVRALLDAGAPVGLGIDGAASNEAGTMIEEMHQALLFARLRHGPTALTARECLRLATSGGARLLGRDRDVGSLEVGKLADLALWRVDGLGAAGIADPVCALVFGNHTPLEWLVVNGRVVVDDGHLVTADVDTLARAARAAARRVVGATTGPSPNPVAARATSTAGGS
jgi:cytosine/adenosine deaminase-related metal-dependent hydrolase